MKLRHNVIIGFTWVDDTDEMPADMQTPDDVLTAFEHDTARAIGAAIDAYLGRLPGDDFELLAASVFDVTEGVTQ